MYMLLLWSLLESRVLFTSNVHNSLEIMCITVVLRDACLN